MQEERLKKQLSPFNVWALAFGCIIGWGAFVMPGNTFLLNAGPLGTAIALGIASVIMIIIAINYGYMINKYPFAGGEFTYTRNAFGSKNAFICSWFLGLSYLAIVPLNGTALALIGRNLMNNIFQVGFSYSVAGYDIYLGEILLAAMALVSLGIMSIKGVKIAGVFQTGLSVILIVGVLAIFVATLFKGDFVDGIRPLYNDFDGNGRINGMLAVIAVAPWAFVGFDTIPQAAEEFKFSHKKARIIMAVAILFGAMIYIILNTATAVVIPDRYENWVEYISDASNLEGLEALPTFNAAYMLLGKAGLFLLGAAVLAAILSGIVGFYMATSRLLYSMSQEKVLPEWFGVMHPKYKTPQNAIIFIMVIALVAPFFGRTALGWIVDMSSLGAAIGYGYTSAAAVKYAAKEKNYWIMSTGVLGVILSLAFAILLLVPIPTLSCSLSKESYFCFLIWCLLGWGFYFVRKNNANH